MADVTGAGDTVIATLSVMLGAGFTPKQAADIANTAAGLVVTKLGAATVSAMDLEAKLGGRGAYRGGVDDASSAAVL